MKELAEQALIGVGDRARGEWHEWTGHAYHVRRRLNADEQLQVGSACDLRRTEEAQKRFAAARAFLPPRAVALAIEELGQS